MLQSIFSIDVEDWFNLSGTGLEPPPSEWDQLESRVERNFRSLLELLAEGGGTATCFFVGYFAKRFPHLVREAMAAGHEIASHGYHHRLVYEMSPDEFYEDALAARELLEDISGRAVRGFRAPAFSVTARTPWFFDKLAAAGYQYDSSVFPAHHQTGGISTDKLATAQRSDIGRNAGGISHHRRAGAGKADVLFRRRIPAALSVPSHPNDGAPGPARGPSHRALRPSPRDRSRPSAHAAQPPPKIHLLRKPSVHASEDQADLA